LIEKTQQISRLYQKQREEIIKKFGICIDEKKKEFTLEGSDLYDEGLKELEALMNKEEEIKEFFKLEDFKDVKSKNPYIQIMKLMQ
jgi:competence protein ComGF